VHQADYGYHFDDGVVEIVTLRVIGAAQAKTLAWPTLPPAPSADLSAARLYVSDTTFDDGRTLPTPRYDRARLLAGHAINGPAIIVQHDSTTLVPPGYRAEAAASGNLHIARSGAA
jgi:N-methylhydantoinase A